VSLDASDKLLATLYEAPMQREMWNVFMGEIVQLCGANKAALLSHDLHEKRHSIAAFFGDMVKDGQKPYESLYCQFDEWTLRFPQFVRGGGAANILRGEQVWPEELLRRSVFYNEFLKKFDVCRMVALAPGGSGRGFDVLSIYRGPAEEPFDREQIAVLEMLAPHLANALTIRHRLLALESRVSDLETALDELETSLVLLGSEGTTVFVNQGARRIFDQRDGLRLCQSRLVAERPSENGRLREIIAKAISGGRSKSCEHGGAVLVSRVDKRSLEVVVSPFVSAGALTPQRAVAVVFITDPDSARVPRSDVLRQLYGLTPAEARLAALLTDGQSLKEVTAAIGVGLETVRSQVKNIFLKTGTRRQSELMRLLICLTNQNFQSVPVIRDRRGGLRNVVLLEQNTARRAKT
jgi:DNA-binding CsgD family transcriptional regulator/PAS domain-containing protein